MIAKSALAIVSIGLVIGSSAMAQIDLMAVAREQFKPIPASPVVLPGNPSSPAKVELGKMLYFDPRLSASHAISCSSCHNIGLGGADAQSTSLGHRWQHGGRNAPTVFNAVFNVAQFWDGRAKDLEQQAAGPMMNSVEMASPAPHVAEQIKGIPGYKPAFEAAFPGDADAITLPHVQQAIAVFEATLITPNAPFDRFLNGDASALSSIQKEGLALFTGKGCSNCHNGINVGGGSYAPFGVVAKPGDDLRPASDKGRFMVTKTAGDEYVFRVPSLRNVTLTAPYFHTGQIWDLRQAVAVMGSSQLGVELNAEQVDKITAFLTSLTGEAPQIIYPILPPSGANTPQPQP